MKIVFENKKEETVLPSIPFIVKTISEDFYLVSKVFNKDNFVLIALCGKEIGLCYDEFLDRTENWLRENIVKGVYEIVDATLTIKTK
jgi:hypothetical protein